ncbi:peptide chain release factor N(5)-glutamine methyltransferase [Arenimonas sp. GDDSR-1]|uniref:peptide chain release factor N(5)-glutamine methyltransferase n=1 Tax=Arenimonas sp. GDDSR-1 TaxID=2950125 RepID=UPI002626179F|nr:peptide chain release factor N(5)-glutamine methyltransferase [Arenimonas sp. GDDSR-1]
MITLAAALRETTGTGTSGLDRIDAEFLLAHVLAKPRAWLYAHADDLLAPEQLAAFRALLKRREGGEPVAYLTGQRGFWSLDLQVTADTLIPRPETERLVELALAFVHPGRPAAVLDLGTGSGAVALAIASERPLSQVTAIDISPAALAVAAANGRRLHLGNVIFEHGDWFSSLGSRRFDIIVSNPPYIADGDTHLGQGDLRFEPRSALAAGADGLDDIRIIVGDAPRHLLPGAWLLLEHGWNQGASVRGLLEAGGFTEIMTEPDLEGRDRVTLGRMV